MKNNTVFFSVICYAFKAGPVSIREKYMRKKPMFIDVQRFASGRVRFFLLLLFTCVGAMTLLLHSQVAHAAQVCANGQQIPKGKYYLFNNLWGANTGSGEQCIWDVANNGSSIAWSTRWNWSGQSQVKSYDSVVLGWHWQKQSTAYLTGLPLQVSSRQQVQTNWKYNFTQNGQNTTFNIAYDLWLHTIPNPTLDAPSDEVMLWLYKQGGVHPVGSPVTMVNMDGATWTLWEGSHNNWQVHTFVRSTNTTGAQSLNLSDFLNYLSSYQGLSSAKYLTGVEAGSAVWLGNAELDTSSYSTDVGSVVGVSPLPTLLPTPTPSPSPTLTPTPLPTPTSPVTPRVTTNPVITPTSTSNPPGNNCFAVFFIVCVPIAVVKCVMMRRRSRLIKERATVK